MYNDRFKPIDTDSFWNMILGALSKFFSKLFENTVVANTWHFLIYGLAFLVLIFAISKLFGMNFTNLFYNKREINRAVEYETIEENIHEIDFNTLIEQAISQGSYRKAVRLYYLKTLKKLSDKEIIDWQKNKTNTDYRYEIQQSNHASAFSEITTIFDYIWYGEFPVDQDLFTQTENKFKQFINSI